MSISPVPLRITRRICCYQSHCSSMPVIFRIIFEAISSCKYTSFNFFFEYCKYVFFVISISNAVKNLSQLKYSLLSINSSGFSVNNPFSHRYETIRYTSASTMHISRIHGSHRFPPRCKADWEALLLLRSHNNYRIPGPPLQIPWSAETHCPHL